MKIFINYFLSFFLFIILILSMTINVINNISSAIYNDILFREKDCHVDFNYLTNINKDFNVLNTTHKISPKKFNLILCNAETQGFINKIVKKIIDNDMSANDFKIQLDTFLNNINSFYNLDLNSNEINNISLQIINSYNKNEFMINATISLIKICNLKKTHIIIYSLIFFTCFILFLRTYKYKTFFKYIGIITLSISFSILLFYFILKLLNFDIFIPINYDIFYYDFIFYFILSAISFIANKRLNKEVVPF